jgi:hypothetical protein
MRPSSVDGSVCVIGALWSFALPLVCGTATINTSLLFVKDVPVLNEYRKSNAYYSHMDAIAMADPAATSVVDE